MNYDAIKIWVDMAQFLWIIGATIWAFWGDRNKDITSRVGEIQGAVATHGERLTRIEAGAGHEQLHADLGNVRGDVRALEAQMEAMNATLKSVHRQLELVNQYLLRAMTEKSFAELRTEDRRLSILLVLESSPAYEANAHLVREAIERYYGHSASLDTVRADLAWLAEQGLVSVEELKGLPLARATSRGLDVALGRSSCPGVKRPLPE